MPNSSRKHRLAAFKRQQGHCYYCGLPMWLEKPTAFAKKCGITERESARLQCTAEHLVARQDGGRNSRENIAAACRFCNGTRHRISSPLMPKRYRDHVLRRLRAGKWHPRSFQHLIVSATGAQSVGITR